MLQTLQMLLRLLFEGYKMFPKTQATLSNVTQPIQR